MTYIDRLNSFYRYVVYNEIPPHAQLVYLHLLNMNNQLEWQEKFCITDRRLETLTGLSKNAVTDAKRILKDRFVEISTDKKKPRQGSCYRLLEILPSIQGKSRGKTQGKNEGKTEGKTQGKLSNIPLLSITKNKEREGEGERASASASNATTDLMSEEVRQCWIQNTGMNPFGETAKVLSELERMHGAELVTVAIKAAKRRGDGTISPNFLESTLEKVLAGTIKYRIDESGEVIFLRNLKGEYKSGKSSDKADEEAWSE